MRQKHLVEEMITIREEMKSLNNRIKTQTSCRMSNNKKIWKYCHEFILMKPKGFQECFISEQYLLELYNKQEWELMLQLTLKFIVKFLQNYQTIQTIQEPQIDKSFGKINKMIRDIVSPIKTKIECQTQFYDQQLKNTHKACQTNFDLGIRQQSSMLSSIQQDNLNSPKFNDHHITNVIDEISFEHLTSIKKDLNSYNTTQKQQDNKFNNDDSSFKDTMRKSKNKTLRSMLDLREKFEDKRFSKKEIPQTILSVDYIRKRRKTPEKYRGFNIITNN